MYSKYTELRDKKGVRDAEVARAIHVGQSVFSDWKTGRSNPKIDKLKAIADYFGVSIEYFVD